MDIRDELDQWAEQRRQDLMKSVFGGGEEEDDFDYEIKDEDGDEDEDMEDDSEEIDVKIEGFEQGDRTEDIEEDPRNTQPPTTHRSPIRDPRTSTAAGRPPTFPSWFLGFEALYHEATRSQFAEGVSASFGGAPSVDPYTGSLSESSARLLCHSCIDWGDEGGTDKERMQT
ncbi:uncharacterized protein J4E79_005362 [Alternaria viburni]|uniref:uncharacterized protein n=1 Tax=Alternaria viburni TaxID=566460 RepID=UPI0020C52B42|nr:uncharacterized protein J4E79_005362 [Alternaria viburni]KAI4660794.1 hypothetical protein J4E79_005362 [Alternaria viburni]